MIDCDDYFGGNLYSLIDKLSVINSAKSRKETERLLRNIITEYGYMLEVFRDTAGFHKFAIII